MYTLTFEMVAVKDSVTSIALCTTNCITPHLNILLEILPLILPSICLIEAITNRFSHRPRLRCIPDESVVNQGDKIVASASRTSSLWLMLRLSSNRYYVCSQFVDCDNGFITYFEFPKDVNEGAIVFLIAVSIKKPYWSCDDIIEEKELPIRGISLAVPVRLGMRLIN